MFAFSLAALLAILAAIGCGGDDLVIGCSVNCVQPTAVVTGTPSTCGQTGDACSLGTDCCSGSCDPIAFTCV